MTLVFAPTMERAIRQVPQLRTDRRNYHYISGADSIRGYERGKSTLILYVPDYGDHPFAYEIMEERIYRGYDEYWLREGEIWQNNQEH